VLALTAAGTAGPEDAHAHTAVGHPRSPSSPASDLRGVGALVMPPFPKAEAVEHQVGSCASFVMGRRPCELVDAAA